MLAVHGGVWLGDSSIDADGGIRQDGEPQLVCGNLIRHLEANLPRNADKEVNGGRCKVRGSPGGHTS